MGILKAVTGNAGTWYGWDLFLMLSLRYGHGLGSQNSVTNLGTEPLCTKHSLAKMIVIAITYHWLMSVVVRRRHWKRVLQDPFPKRSLHYDSRKYSDEKTAVQRPWFQKSLTIIVAYECFVQAGPGARLHKALVGYDDRKWFLKRDIPERSFRTSESLTTVQVQRLLWKRVLLDPFLMPFLRYNFH